MPAIAMPIKPADTTPKAAESKKPGKTKPGAEDPAAAKIAAARSKNLDLAIQQFGAYRVDFHCWQMVHN